MYPSQVPEPYIRKFDGTVTTGLIQSVFGLDSVSLSVNVDDCLHKGERYTCKVSINTVSK